MIIIDPLKLKIQQLLSEGKPYPLNQARQSYGTEDDIAQLIREFGEVRSDVRRYALVDLTPFERIGRLEDLIRKLHEFKDPRPVVMIMSEEIYAGMKAAFPSGIPILTAIFSSSGNFLSIDGGSEEDKTQTVQVNNDFRETQTTQVNNDFLAKSASLTLGGFRRWFTEQSLTQLLFYPDCLDIPSRKDSSENTVYISGRYYRKMPNNMLVSCYLNLKQIGNDYKALTSLAYEIVLELMGFFRRDVDLSNAFDVLVTPNNTALFLASTVQSIIEKPIIAIDRLGPIPALQLQRARLAESLKGRRVTVVEEVIATGNEVDRAIMFLNHLGAHITRIIALYNLEVGRPMLLEDEQLVSLCKPKRELGYVYRSQ